MAFSLSTESLASASARRPWLVIAAWAALFAVSVFLILTLLGDALTTEVRLTNDPESERANAILEEWRGETHDNEIIIVQSETLTVDDPAFQAHAEELFAGISALPADVVLGGTSYYLTGDESLVSADRHVTIMPFVMAGDKIDADDNISQVLDLVAESDEAAEFRVLAAGGASINHDFQEQAEKDLTRGEAIGIPIAFLVLVLVFGALTAALVPLVLGIFSIVVAIGLTALFGQVFQFSFFVTNVITMMGLAVGIDYSLFIVSRYREERGKGLEKHAAIHAAASTASRAVFFSGMTVVFSLLGMLLVPSTIFRSLGAGAIIVVVVSIGVTLTLLPAILGVLGDGVNTLRVPFVGRSLDKIDHERTGGFWDRISRTVMRYPVISLILGGGLMIALAVPYLDIKTGSAGVSTLPRSTDSFEAFTLVQDEFNFGLIAPTEIVISDGDITRPDVQASIERLSTALADDPLFGAPTFEANPDQSIGLLSVDVNADPSSEEAVAAVRNLRGELIPAAFEGVEAEVLVGGATAGNIDYFDTTGKYTPIVIAFVLGLSFVLLMIVFRSIIVPLKAIVMNLLSVGAAYGVLVLVFQKGVGNELFGFQQVDIIEAWVPLWTFSILFGLSMDYHVFLLSRIRERFNYTHDNRESVAFGLRSTAGLITGAALIMASVFMGIALGELVMFQQMGFGLAVAVMLDATIVRSVLVPAAMELLGERNWYLPSALSWLPELRTEGPAEPAPSGAEAS
ncbi:MAG: MMPL family transporter [Chloroflexi bacterium]|nr:MMPL family transporter [Chloroflexota bacterium]